MDLRALLWHSRPPERIAGAAPAMITMRAATPGDRPALRGLLAAAFAPEDVAAFLDALRAEGCVIGEWMAEDGTGTVGCIAFSRVHVAPKGAPADGAAPVPVAMLTPMAVRPGRQREGIGTALMAHALDALEARGERHFVVLGHPDLYRRAGFRAGNAADIESPWSGSPAFMARSEAMPRGRLILPETIANQG